MNALAFLVCVLKFMHPMGCEQREYYCESTTVLLFLRMGACREPGWFMGSVAVLFLISTMPP